MTLAATRSTLHRRIAEATPGGLAALAAFSAVAVGAGLGRSLVTTYLPVLLDRIRDAPGLIGTVMLVNTVAGFVGPLIIGAWSDRLRARGHGRTLPVVLGGALVTAGGMVAIAFGNATSYAALALFAAIAYLGLNAVTTGHRALIPQTFGARGRASATAGEELAMLVGTLAGVVAGGLLLDGVGPWAPFALGALALPALAVPTVVQMRGREGQPVRVPAQRLRLRGYLRAAGRPGVRLVLAAQTLWVLGYVGLPPFFVLYAQRVLDLRASTAAVMLAGFGLATGAAMLGAGAVRPQHHRTLLVIGALAMGAGMLAVAAGTTVVAVVPALIPVAVGFGLLTTLGFPVFSSYIPPGEEGAYSALYFATRSLASAVALPAAGWTIAATGNYRMLFIFGGAVTLAAALPLLRLEGGPPRTLLRAATARAALFASATALLLAAVQFIHRTELLRLDEALFRALDGFASTPEIVDELIVDPHLRNYVILVVVVAGVAAWVRGRTSPRRAVLLVAGSAFVAYVGVRTCWALWERPRPEELLGTAPPTGHTWSAYPSFPSGHMAVTTAIVASTTALVPQLRIALWTYAAVVAWTRITYGAHFPSDVVAGLALGWLAAKVTVSPLDHHLVRRPSRPSPAALRGAARAGGAVALATFGLLGIVFGVPAAPEGGLLHGAMERQVQVGLLVLAAVSLAAAWRRSAFGAALVVTGAVLGVFAAVQYTPGFAGLVFAAFAVPGTLFLLSVPRARPALVAALVGTIGVAGAAGAVAVHARVYGPAHPESRTAALPPGPVAWAWSGAVTTDGVTVTARIPDGGRARLLVGRGRELLDARTSEVRRVDPRGDGLVSLRVGGLRPGAAYTWALEVDGRLDLRHAGRFRTFPAGRASFSFAVGACARVGSNGAVFDAVRRTDPLFFLVSGDLFYANIDDPSPSRFVDAYSSSLEQPAQAALHRAAPVAYTWDDHDFAGNGSDGTAVAGPTARSVYDRAVPHFPLDRRRGGTIHQAFTVGRVRVLIPDTRSARSPAEQRDDAAKTMLGARQKAWLKHELLAARDRAALTVLSSSVPWIGAPQEGGDSWVGYATERAELSRFIARHRIRNVVMVAGDAHMVAIDDGSNSDYSGTGRAGFPVLHAGALDRPGSLKGGPYSEGAFPGAGQFGTVRVDDRGDRVDVELQGRRYTGRTLVRHRFSLAVGRR